MIKFETKYEKIIDQLHRIDPIKYAHDRNYLDGHVSYLSPYISRGVISTKQVFDYLISAGYQADKMEKFVQELAWRDYWQLVWKEYQSGIDKDLKNRQDYQHLDAIPTAILHHQTGIEAIDHGIEKFYHSGYLHNHLRMYIASLATNVAKCHWHLPAKWMYYHLLDADWASNALSWQWVCGANSQKKYFANQENINKYCKTRQRGSFLDVDYSQFEDMAIPESLKSLESPVFETKFPETPIPILDSNLPTLIYNFYNVDPLWRKEMSANRVLLLEPSVFKQYPVASKSLQFCIDLAKENIENAQLFVGEFAELKSMLSAEIYYKEHPLNNYQGVEDSRDWMSRVKGYYPSFFGFWKRASRELG